MHASNPSNCTADEMNVRLVSLSEGTRLEEVFQDLGLLAISAGLAAPSSDLTWLQGRANSVPVFVCEHHEK